ncbi:hypothetical protein AOLI_G00298860 [Acnodon oligacanthus]
MFFLMFLLLLWSVSDAADDCSPTVSIMHSPNGIVCLGKSFTLTCSFGCPSMKYNLQILKDGNLTQNSTNSPLHLVIDKTMETDSGQYTCRTFPPNSTGIHTLTIAACPVPSEVETLAVQPTHDPPSPWNLQSSLMWYLLCKTGVFLMFLMVAALKFTCRIH